MITARSAVDVRPGSLRWRVEPPVALRRTGSGRVHLVQAGGGPLGGDDLQLRLRLAPQAHLAVRSAAATVVQPGVDPTPASWSLLADVGAHAGLSYQPEPTVICDRATLHSHTQINLATGAWLVLRELVVLGRYGERGGHYRGDLRVDVEGEPLLAHSTVLDGADAGLCGPGGSGGARVFGSLLLAGEAANGAQCPLRTPGLDSTESVRWAVTDLEGPGVMVLALGSTEPPVADLLNRFAVNDACSGQ